MSNLNYIEFKVYEGDFNLIHIFECGQCFRWFPILDNLYAGIVDDEAVYVKHAKNTLYVFGSKNEAKWHNYFDLSRNYKEIKQDFFIDPIVSLASKFAYGIRILKQDIWETLISFIISANNNIKRIRKIISELCKKFGKPILFHDSWNFGGDQIFYTFPRPNSFSNLNLIDFSSLRMGFRDKYVLEAARKVVQEEINFNDFFNLSNEEILNLLKQFKGIGEKIASCILLFGFSRTNVFPIDVHIERIFREKYNMTKPLIAEFASLKFGENSGIAQQYLYYYFRRKIFEKV